MTTIALFGGTGRTGRRVLSQGVARGLRFRVLARDPLALGPMVGVEVIGGDVLSADAVAAVVAGSDAVCSTLGGGALGDPGSTRSTGMTHIVQAMRAAGVRRVVGVAGGGILDSPAGGLRSEQPGYPAVFRSVTAEHRATWEVLRASGLAWTLFCPPDIPDAPPTGRYRMLEDQMPDGPGRELATGDLADALLDALLHERFVGKRVGIKH